MKATEQYFPVVMITMLRKVVLGFTFVGGILEQIFPLVLFPTLYKIFLSFTSKDKISKWGKPNEPSPESQRCQSSRRNVI